MVLHQELCSCWICSYNPLKPSSVTYTATPPSNLRHSRRGSNAAPRKGSTPCPPRKSSNASTAAQDAVVHSLKENLVEANAKIEALQKDLERALHDAQTAKNKLVHQTHQIQQQQQPQVQQKQQQQPPQPSNTQHQQASRKLSDSGAQRAPPKVKSLQGGDRSRRLSSRLLDVISKHESEIKASEEEAKKEYVPGSLLRKITQAPPGLPTSASPLASSCTSSSDLSDSDDLDREVEEGQDLKDDFVVTSESTFTADDKLTEMKKELESSNNEIKELAEGLQTLHQKLQLKEKEVYQVHDLYQKVLRWMFESGSGLSSSAGGADGLGDRSRPKLIRVGLMNTRSGKSGKSAKKSERALFITKQDGSMVYLLEHEKPKAKPHFDLKAVASVREVTSPPIPSSSFSSTSSSSSSSSPSASGDFCSSPSCQFLDKNGKQTRLFNFEDEPTMHMWLEQIKSLLAS